MTPAIQVYLSPEQHAALQAAAESSGRSMRQVLRDLIDAHLVPDAPPPTDFSRLVGTIRTGRRTDVGREQDRVLGEVLRDLRRR